MAIIFICGPDPRNHPENFNRIEEIAKQMGYTVLNPATLPPDLCNCSYLPIYLAMLEAADLIYILPGCVDDDESYTLMNYAHAQKISHIYSIRELNDERIYWQDYKQEDFFTTIDYELWRK